MRELCENSALNEKVNSSRRKLLYFAELTSTLLLNKFDFFAYNNPISTACVNFLHGKQATEIGVRD